MPSYRNTWKRKPEPLNKIEGVEEYTAFADNSFKQSDQAVAEQIAAKIPPDFAERVIDLGSGPGNIAIPLALLRPDLHIICFDFNQDMLDVAAERAKKENVIDSQGQGRMKFQLGQMERLTEVLPDTHDVFVFSNTALHEVRSRQDFVQTVRGIAALVGRYGGCFIRDLLLPEDAEQAEAWRREVLQGTAIPERHLELFINSQHAAFPISLIQQTIDRTALHGRGVLIHSRPPQSRYWIYEVSPQADGRSATNIASVVK
jgi:SAM-dependent methyltransferase